MNQIVGTHDIVFMTLDTLRYDIASEQFAAGHTPHFAKLFPDGWEKRHSPGSFTYAAHHAFFAGFLPTPADPTANQDRLFASNFAGSVTTGSTTKVFHQASIMEGLESENYHTACIGGVGFFNKKTALSGIFPAMFQEAHWEENLGVTDQNSTENQFNCAQEISKNHPELLFLFINISAIHQPNSCYSSQHQQDNLETHANALSYVDSQLPTLIETMQQRSRPTLYIICADHGTLYGEDGRKGHRVGHQHVYTVPYAHTIL